MVKPWLRRTLIVLLFITICALSAALVYAGPTLVWSYQVETPDTTGLWQIISSVAISSDGLYIAAGSWNEKVYFFRHEISTPSWSYDTCGYANSVGISADGQYIAAGSWACSYDTGKVFLFNRVNGTPVWTYAEGKGYKEEDFYSVAVSSDGRFIVAGSGWLGDSGGRTYLFSRNSSNPLWYYDAATRIGSVAISSDGYYIAAAGIWTGQPATPDYRVYFFSRDSDTPLWSYKTRGFVNSVAISSDGRYVAAAEYGGGVYLFSRDSSLPVWNYNTGDTTDRQSQSLVTDGT
jgi:WD40 repeat protein